MDMHTDTAALRAAVDAAIGAELKGLRVKRNLTRDELKNLTGLGLSTIQRTENGERSPELQELALMLRVLNEPMSEFIARALRDVEGVE